MTKGQKDEIARRLARAITDSFNRSNEIPSEEELRTAILYLLDSKHALSPPEKS